MPVFRMRFAVLSLSCALLSSCAGVKSTNLIATREVYVSGKVHGGQQPVSGSTIQLYAAGTGGAGSAATPLVSTPVATDSGGYFNLNGLFTCPTANTQVYLTATGGNPGLGGNVTNGDLAMMLALGSCGSLAESTNVVINELTTVASVWSMAKYMTSFSSVGSDPTDLAGLSDAFAAVNQVVDPATGTSPGPAVSSSSTLDAAMLNTLADIVSECVNSTTATAGDSTACGQILGYTTANGQTPQNTVDLMLQIANNPNLNVAAMFNLVASQSPFEPILASAPAAWSVPTNPVTSTPVISPVSGTYDTAQTVTLTDTTPGAVIYYTLNATNPTTKSAVYSQPLTVSSAETLMVMAIAPGYGGSAVATANYCIASQHATQPTFNPAGGMYTSAINVTISTATAGATIYYTTDGSTPTAMSHLYTAPVKINSATTLNAVAVSPTAAYSSVGSANYNFQFTTQAIAPTFSLAAGTYIGAQQLSLSSTTTGAKIYYTLDGSQPSATNGQIYTAPITVSTSETVNAITTAANYSASTVSTAAYVIQSGNDIIITFAGNGAATHTGDGQQATSASLSSPQRVALDASGDLFIADSANCVVREVDTTGKITTVAGSTCPATSTAPYSGEGGAATSAILSVADVAVDPNNGTLYIADSTHGRVLQVVNGIITTTIGDGYIRYNGEQKAGLLTSLISPIAIAVDGSSNLYVDDNGTRIRILSTPSGGSSPVVQTLAGNGTAATGAAVTSGAVQGSLPYIKDISVAPDGSTLYFATAVSVLQYGVSTNLISTLAGYNGTTAPVTGTALGTVFTSLSSIDTLTTTTGGITSTNVYILDAGTTPSYYSANGSTAYLATPDGKLAYVAGNGFQGFAGDGGVAVSAEMDMPGGIAVAPTGDFYIADTANNRVRKVTSGTPPIPDAPTFSPDPGVQLTGNSNVSINSTATNATIYYTTDGTAPTTASTVYTGPITLQYGTTIYAIVSVPGEGSSRVAKATYTFPSTATPVISPASCPVQGLQYVTITDSTPNVTIYYTVDGTYPTTKSLVYNGRFVLSKSTKVIAMAIAPGYSIGFYATAYFQVNETQNAPTFTPGSGAPSFGLYPSAQQVEIASGGAPGNVTGITCTSPQIYYTTDGSTPTTSSTKNTGLVSVAGPTDTLKAMTVWSGYPNSPVSTANYLINPDMKGVMFTLNPGPQYYTIKPTNVATSGTGTLYFTTGTTSTPNPNDQYAGQVVHYDIASNKIVGIYSSGIPSAGYLFNRPMGLVADTSNSGNLYVADYGNNRVAVIDTNHNTTTTLATVVGPMGLAINQGNIYVSTGTAVYQIASGTSTTTLFAGGGSCSSLGDGGPATSACLSGASGLAMSSTGILYIADAGHSVVRAVQNGTISTVAGTGYYGLSGDMGPATQATLMTPTALSLDPGGNLYIVDSAANVVRKLTVSTGNINTVVGNPLINQSVASTSSCGSACAFYYGQGALTEMPLTTPLGAAVATDGTLYVVPASTYVAGDAEQIVFGDVYAKAPTFDIPQGTYSSDQFVTITSATPGASIIVNVTTPTTNYSYEQIGSASFDVSESGTTTITAFARRDGYDDSAPVTQVYTIQYPQAPTPSITPGTGTYTDKQTVSITASGYGTTIYYTTDGSTPTTSSPIYNGTFTVDKPGTVVKAIATQPEHSTSNVASATFTINYSQTPTPSILPGSTTATAAFQATITESDTKATVYFTTDGTTPTSSSTQYTGPITISQSTVLKAIAIDGYHPTSATASATYQLVSVQNGGPLVDFGTVSVGTAAPSQTFPVANTSSSTVYFTGLTFSNPTGDYSYTTTCKTSLAPGASCSGTVNFTPSATGTSQATLTITTTSTSQPKIVITFTGVGQ